MEDLSNRDFGFLTALEPVENQKSAHQLWKCHCNRCGNDTVVRKYDLLNGVTTSCGCYKKDVCSEIARSGLTFENGTELGHLSGEKAYKNNKTGYRGVIKDKKSGLYIANINLAKHQYYLGKFETPEEAYAAYLAAKEKLHHKVLSGQSDPIPTLPPMPRNRKKRKKRKNSMTDAQRYNAVTKAAKYTDKDAYLSDLVLSSLWGDAEDEVIDRPTMDKRMEELGKIYDSATITVSEIRASTGLTQNAFSKRFCVPVRTLQDWEGGKRTPPLYVILLLAAACGLTDIFKDEG
jgi:DNA-binding transcriptional regulator YiaG